MGVPIVTPMGATGGAGEFTAIDQTVELTAIATAITAQGAALTLEIERLRLTLADIVSALGSIADHAKATSSAVGSVSRSVGNVSSAVSDAAVTQQAVAASTIKKNNFDTEIVSKTLTMNGQEIPQLPPIADQLKSQLKESAIISQVTKAENLVKDKINSTLSDATDWAKQALGVDNIIADLKNQLPVIAIPDIPSPDAVARDAAAAAGVPLPE